MSPAGLVMMTDSGVVQASMFYSSDKHRQLPNAGLFA